MTSRFAVLGSPISHSKSPAIHTAAFKAMGVDAAYDSQELSEHLAEWVQGLPDSYRGLSITMPLKEQALALAERADPIAIATNAANTLVRTNTGWDAYNTDVFGIQRSISHLKVAKALVLGSGATARSAVVALQELGIEVSIWARNSKSAKTLAFEFEALVCEDISIAKTVPLVISTLPGGALDEYLGQLESPSGVLLDVAYHPWPSKAAEHWGVNSTISGLEMLIWQAIGQQRLFNGNSLDEPLEAEKEVLLAIRAALEMAK